MGCCSSRVTEGTNRINRSRCERRECARIFGVCVLIEFSSLKRKKTLID
jgi:hypothetical protein